MGSGAREKRVTGVGVTMRLKDRCNGRDKTARSARIQKTSSTPALEKYLKHRTSIKLLPNIYIGHLSHSVSLVLCEKISHMPFLSYFLLFLVKEHMLRIGN